MKWVCLLDGVAETRRLGCGRVLHHHSFSTEGGASLFSHIHDQMVIGCARYFQDEAGPPAVRMRIEIQR